MLTNVKVYIIVVSPGPPTPKNMSEGETKPVEIQIEEKLKIQDPSFRY